MEPPTYSTGRIPTNSVLINLCPLPDASSFLVGSLGFGSPSLEGEIQIKYNNHASPQNDSQPPRYNKLVVDLVGTECGPGVERAVIVEESVVVWDSTTPQSSTSASNSSSNLPASSTFVLQLTNDLPQCIHRLNSSLEYTLSATLFSPDCPPLRRRTPIHLQRSTNPAQQHTTTTPPPLTIEQPVKAHIQLAKTTFRRSEVIGLVARVEVPSSKTIEHDRTRLRTVSAELVRKITVVDESAERPHLSTHGSATSRGKENAERNWGDQPEASSSQPSPLEPATPLGLSSPEPAPATEAAQDTVLARSGKSCRFSHSRPIILKLLLHPPNSIACESITQSTLVHAISFEVRVTIGLVNGGTGRRQECLLTQEVTILPDWPAPSAVALEKQREVRASAVAEEEGRVPTYNESDSDPVSSFAPTTYIGDMEPPLGWDEDEYDGYEELSAQASSVPPPPAIDEDVSPPSAADAHLTRDSSNTELVVDGLGQLQLGESASDPSAPTSAESPAQDLATPPPASPSSSLAPALPPSFIPSPFALPSLSPPSVPAGLPPPYAGDGPPSYASTQPVGVTDHGLLYNLHP